MTLFIRSFLWANVYFDKSPLKCHETKRTPAVSTPPVASCDCFCLTGFSECSPLVQRPYIKACFIRSCSRLVWISVRYSQFGNKTSFFFFLDAPGCRLRAWQEWPWAWMVGEYPLCYLHICVNARLADMVAHMWLNHTLFWYPSRMPVLSFNLRSLSNMLRLINYT